MGPVEALQWATIVTGVLGGGALGIKKLLTIWGKESALSSGALAANDIIVALREEVETQRKNAKHFSAEHEAAMKKISDLHNQNANLRDQVNRLKLNNDALYKVLKKHNLLETAKSHVTFSNTDLGNL